MAGKGIMSSLRGKMFEWQITLKEMKMVIIKYCRNSFSYDNLILYTSFCPLSIFKKVNFRTAKVIQIRTYLLIMSQLKHPTGKKH